MLEMDYNDLYTKLMKLGDENKLEINIELSRFPIVATIRPNLEERNQLRMNLEELETDSNFVNGEIKLIFDDELTMKVLNDFKIEDNLLNKIKGMAKKLHYLFLQIYFKEKMMNYSKKTI